VTEVAESAPDPLLYKVPDVMRMLNLSRSVIFDLMRCGRLRSVKEGRARMHCYIVVSLLTGARTEELRALTWDHVDLDGDLEADPPIPPYVAVWRSVRKGGDTKTRKSRRTLALPARCVTLLRNHRRAQDFARQHDELHEWQDNGLVFATALGTPLDAHNVRRDFRDALKAVPGLVPAEWTPREPRHSFVSVLADNGVSIEEISQLVGHRSTAVTELVYRKQIRPVLQSGTVVMDNIFGLDDQADR
jgi:integrase